MLQAKAQAAFWAELVELFEMARDLIAISLIESKNIVEKHALAHTLLSTQEAIFKSYEQKMLFTRCGILEGFPPSLARPNSAQDSFRPSYGPILRTALNFILDNMGAFSPAAGRCLWRVASLTDLLRGDVTQAAMRADPASKAYVNACKAYLSGWRAPSTPGRDSQGHISKLTASKTIPQRIFGQINNIEIAAAESCALMLIRYGKNISHELQLILAEQVLDEMRHALILNVELEKCIDNATSMPEISFEIWDVVYKATSITECLCGQQVIGEGYSIGNDLLLRDFYRANDKKELSEIHEFIHADEVEHARNGLAQFKEISGRQYGKIISEMENKISPSTPCEPYFFEELRLNIGFSHEDIERQRKLSRKKELLGEKVSIFN